MAELAGEGLMVSVVPSHYDPQFIFDEAGVGYPAGYKYVPGGVRLVYPIGENNESAVAVDTVINDYPVRRLKVDLPEKLEAINSLRDYKIAHFNFGGLVLDIDTETIANLTALVVGLDRQPSMMSIKWSIGGGNWIDLDRATSYALADAAFLYVQACFANAYELTVACKAAADIDALDAVDISLGWPG